MTRLLEDKIAMVTGAAQGIGQAIAEAMAEHGADVAAIAAFGRVDILVNDAAILRPHLVVDFPEEEWDATFAVNAKGVFLCSQAVVRQMIEQGDGGAIISIASCSGKKADSKHAAYSASKAAVMAFTRVLALEPGLFEDLKERTVLGKIAQPSDQANVAVFLASDLAGHITGESIIVSGGEMMGQ
jgi:NAD(P)-dependent dehydrogenase (short-subunit alcohol dehydrogenase family)